MTGELFRRQNFQEIKSLQELEARHSARKLFGFQNMSSDLYHAGPGLSQSVLKGYEKSPAHARMAMAGIEQTESMRLGEAAHAAVFENHRYKDEWVMAPAVDRRTKEGKAAWAAAMEAAQGKNLISQGDAEIIEGIVASLKPHPFYQYIEEAAGYPELSYYWETAGLLCKARFDWITNVEPGSERIIFDLKTTEYGANPRGAKSAILKYGYDIQAAWYLSALPDARFIFIFADKKPPYPVGMYELSREAISNANAKIDGLLGRHVECLKRDEWPQFYSMDVITLDL